MNNLIIRSALIISASTLLLNSCGDDTSEKPDTASGKSNTTAGSTTPAPPAELSTEAIAAWAAPILNLDSVAELSGIETAPPDARGYRYCKLTYTIKENRYSKDFAPEELNNERQLINESANRAMRPESHYLMQIGAPAEYIKDEDRQAKPLPENLQQQLSSMTELAMPSVYTLRHESGSKLVIPIRFRAEQNGGQWQLSEFAFDGADLTRELDFSNTIPQSKLPENANILTPEFIEARKAEIRAKADTFNRDVAALITERETAARASLVQREAAVEEEARLAAAKAAEDQARADELRQTCKQALAADTIYTGEWTRDKRFGQLSLQINEVNEHDNALQFFGEISDPKIPGSRVHIEGRCAYSRDEKNCYTISITIYDGFYDPNQPTAEVFDSKDGYLELKLDENGKLSGTMSCFAWQNTPAKAFSINLSKKTTEKQRK